MQRFTDIEITCAKTEREGDKLPAPPSYKYVHTKCSCKVGLKYGLHPYCLMKKGPMNDCFTVVMQR